VEHTRETRTIQQLIDQMQVKVGSPHAPVRNLSGGNQQKVVIGKWLLTNAQIYLLHDPTRGIDVGTKQEIYRLIRQLADDGAGILFFSTELSELVGLCDRVMVFYEGRIFRELIGGDINEETIISAALGLGSADEQKTKRGQEV
jgi:ribose transport system ATP-binding protein